MWGRSSTVLEQADERRQKPCLFFVQCLQRLSLLYLPESICAWMVAIATLDGEDPAVAQRGCGVDRDMNLGLKNTNEV